MINYKLQVKAGGTRPEVLDFSLGNITKPKVFNLMTKDEMGVENDMGIQTIHPSKPLEISE